MDTPSSDDRHPAKPVVVKKYANRRLYNTATSSYVTLDDLAKLIKEGGDFIARDAKTGEDPRLKRLEAQIDALTRQLDQLGRDRREH